MKHHLAAFITVAAGCLFGPTSIGSAADDTIATVHLRSTSQPLIGSIRFDDAGLTVDSEDDGESDSQFIPWDSVRSVDMANPPPELYQYMQVAEDLWRARSRLQRSDIAMAEPLFEQLFERYRGQNHTTALIVAEGLLRCRLARYDLTRAVVPALEVTRLHRAGHAVETYASLPPVLDPDMALCMYLPPVWIDDRAAQQLQLELAQYDDQGDAVVTALAQIYQAAARLHHDQPELSFNREATRHAGVRLLRDLVIIQSVDPAMRSAAQQRLASQLNDLPDWAQAWTHYTIGISMLHDPDPDSAELGALQLSYLPARFPHNQPYLAGLALQHLLDYFQGLGDNAAAASLRAELTQRYAFHPLHRISN